MPRMPRNRGPWAKQILDLSGKIKKRKEKEERKVKEENRKGTLFARKVIPTGKTKLRMVAFDRSLLVLLLLLSVVMLFVEAKKTAYHYQEAVVKRAAAAMVTEEGNQQEQQQHQQEQHGRAVREKFVVDDAGGFTMNDDDDEIIFDVKDPGTVYSDFVAHNISRTCTGDAHSRPFNTAILGANMGGHMVLEPWITPSLFYQFIGKGEGSAAWDCYTFCEVLGGEEANRQLHNHWKTWVTEDHFIKMAAAGVNSLRVPVGDFQFIPYGPYLNGCWEGGLEYLDQLLDWAAQYNMPVLLDIHAHKDSQNGFDNSGQAMDIQWTTKIGYEFAPAVTFEHWPIRNSRWMGNFSYADLNYTSINYDNIQHSLKVIAKIVERYKDHPGVLGLEPVNEPWEHTPIPELKQFYWEGYLIVKQTAPTWKYVMHSSFRPTVEIWGGFMDGCPDRALDMHVYQAFSQPYSRISYYQQACDERGMIQQMEQHFGPVIVGEWSLATDSCIMWLEGWNDNVAGLPNLPCKYIPCSDPYMGLDAKQPNTPPDPTKPYTGPYGTGSSGPSFGLCPVDRDWIKEQSGSIESGTDWIRAPPKVPKHLDDTDNVMKHLAAKKIRVFAGIGHGYYFWNFRTDLYSPQWSYLSAIERGWIPNPNDGGIGFTTIRDACKNEFDGDLKCVIKHNARDPSILGAIHWINDVSNATKDDRAIEGLRGDALRYHAGILVDKYYQRHPGTTCDFGGIGMMIESTNTTYEDDDTIGGGYSSAWNDDEYYTTVIVHTGMPIWAIVALCVVGTIVGCILGFMVAMRTSKKFNKKVRESKFFSSSNLLQHNIVRKSLSLGALDISDWDDDKGGNSRNEGSSLLGKY